MVLVCSLGCRNPALHTLVRIALDPVVHSPLLRYLHHQVHPLVFLEKIEERTLPQDDGMGGCHSLCLSGGLFHQHLLLPELSDPHLLVGEIAAGGRLPGSEQAELRPPRTHHSPLLPPGTTHHAGGRWQVLHRETAMEVQTTEGVRQCGAKRHSGF